MNIDFDRLRNDLENELYAMMFNGTPEVMFDLDNVRNASDNELINMAMSYGFNLNDYETRSR